MGVPRLVNISSETVPGFFFPERSFMIPITPVTILTRLISLKTLLALVFNKPLKAPNSSRGLWDCFVLIELGY